MPFLTKEHAQQIARKLGAQIETGRRSGHDLAVVYYQGLRVLQFGIRRGSNKDKGHDHLPNDLHLTPRENLLLARCPLTYEEWLEKMREKGLIPG